ncbi:hypothetical protein NX059_011893 [Plenodomus lindquistii]|nr:hypothetical protein NX059_011893 [Plenodomus lindquistii]
MASNKTGASDAHQQTSSSPPSYSSFRSSRASASDEGIRHLRKGLATLEARSKPGDEATPIEILVDMMYQMNVSGPYMFMGNNDKVIGRGGQFTVYEQRTTTPREHSVTCRTIAFKVPRYPLDPGIPFRLADTQARRHLRHIFLEILALTNPSLRRHRNIARLWGWAYGDVFQSTLGLVMELAQSNLLELLRHNEGALSPSVKYQICRDVASGLDAVHDCLLIHGDLKPENVLIFQSGSGRYTAKLADFGLTINEDEESPDLHAMGGTAGWQAPEVENGDLIDGHLKIQTDSFSYGLLMWSVFLHKGNAPSSDRSVSRRSIALEEVKSLLSYIGERHYRLLRETLSQLLQDNPSERPTRLEEILAAADEMQIDLPVRDIHLSQEIGADITFSADTITRESLSPASDVSDFMDQHFDGGDDTLYRSYEWEPPTLPELFIRELWVRFTKNTATVHLRTLFSTFLSLTAKPDIGDIPPNAALELLFVAAIRGSDSARGVVPRVLEYYDQTPPEKDQSHLHEWLRRSVATGSLLAREQLDREAPATTSDCLERFRQMGGYAGHYQAVGLWDDGPLQGHLPPKGDSLLHWLATYGSAQDLLIYLDSRPPEDVNTVNTDMVTPLYNACSRGSWELVRILLDRGADPRIPCTPRRITCLHWVFAFDKNNQQRAIARLVQAGADLDAMTTDVTPFLHYPFVLPSGSALHWAVVLGAYTTTKALLEAGSNVLLRNGCDPYTYDLRVRIPTEWGPNQDPYSVASHEVQGLSPLDYAAMNYDPFIFELLVQMGASVDINAADEEGFTVMHRLSTAPRRETRTGVVFSHVTFLGNTKEVQRKISRVLAAAKALGGDMELFTRSPQPLLAADDGEPRFSPRTPLMMAALGQDTAVMKALLDAGANVETRNETGKSALMCITGDRQTAYMKWELLISRGANIHQSTRNGLVPVIAAARALLIEVVDMLLSKGVDIDTRDSMYGGCSLFAFLSEDPDSTEELDVAVAALLSKHVFSSSNVAKRNKVIELGDADGTTLLHHFASAGMPHCVDALLRHGAPVNSLRYDYLTEKRGDTYAKISWYVTPLDMAMEEKKSRWDELGRDSGSTFLQIKGQCEKIDSVVSLLEKAGGLQKAGLRCTTLFAIAEHRVGSRAWEQAVREL